MNEIERNIFISDIIFKNEYSYMYGENKNNPVSFSYYHTKKDKVKEVRTNFNYSDAITFARYRANDKRYKNYQFLIY